MNDIVQAVRFQFENYDGTGFPNRLVGDKIPVFARILSAVRAYDSLTSGENGHELTADDALSSLQRGAGSLFDPEIVSALKVLFGSESMHQEVTMLSSREFGADAII
jgi:response regulator RpfG family c-di-GMP phosphodiesterase